MTDNTSIILKCEKIIREIANYFAFRITDKPFRQEISKKLKFQSENDWQRLCSLMDVLSDTEMAKLNFMKFGISGPTKIIDYGERLLRLYGITNAAYLQKSAVITFIELAKLPNKKIEVNRINECELIEFRNIVGAHTVDFIDKDGNTNPHQVSRSLRDNESISTSDRNNTFKEFNLKDLVQKFDDQIEDVLIRATEKFIKTTLKNGGAKRTKYLELIQALKCLQKGGVVIWPEPTEELFIVKLRD